MHIDVLSNYIDQLIAQGYATKTVLIGLSGEQVDFAIAAGLRSAQDDGHFQIFARYLLHKKFENDACYLILPAMPQDENAFMISMMRKDKSVKNIMLLKDGNEARTQDYSSQNVYPDLMLPGQTIPAIMRRELDTLFALSQIDPPKFT